MQLQDYKKRVYHKIYKTKEERLVRGSLSSGIRIGKRKFTKTQITLLLLVIPFMAFLVVFYYAQLFGWAYAFVDYNPGKPIWKMEWMGLRHFAKMFSKTSGFGVAFRNTLIYGLIGILTSPLPAIFAICLTEIRSVKLQKTVQVLSSFPNFISWVLVYSLCFIMFSTEGQMTRLFLSLGLTDKAQSVLSNADAAYLFQTALSIWKSLGWGAILYLSAIASIDQELLDAAAVDGANRFQRIMNVTVPAMVPTFFTLLIMNIASMFRAGFEQYYMFYNSMVSEKLDVIATYVYRRGLGSGDISYAVAVGMVQSLLSMILLYFANKATKKATGTSFM